MDFSVTQQYRICTSEYREGTRASSRLVPKFRNCTLCNWGEQRYCRGTDWELQSSIPLSAAVPKLYYAKRGNRGTAREPIGNSSHQYPLSTAVPKLYSAKRGNRGTAEEPIGNSSHQSHLIPQFRICNFAERWNRGTAREQIGNSSHQHTRATAAAPNKQLRDGDLS